MSILFPSSLEEESLSYTDATPSRDDEDTNTMTQISLVESHNSQCRFSTVRGHRTGCACASSSSLSSGHDDIKPSDLSQDQNAQAGAEASGDFLSLQGNADGLWSPRPLGGYPHSNLAPLNTPEQFPLHIPTLSHTAFQTTSSGLHPNTTSFGYADQFGYQPWHSMGGETALSTSTRDVKSINPRRSSDSERSASDDTASPSSPCTTFRSPRASYGPHHGGQMEKQMNFPELKIMHQLYSKEQKVMPQIEARMDKNLMWVDNQWTCYRRNYITIQVHYFLDPNVAETPLHVDLGDSRGKKTVKALGVCLAATMDEEKGKPIGLIQHTAKRDRGPQKDVEIAKLPPLIPGAAMPPFHGTCRVNGPYLPFQIDNDQQNNTIPPQGQHTFERIQFKQATANNGRRRAQQQFYHIMVELYADIRENPDDDEKWVKVAYKISDAMVVRGRSPGHYKDTPSTSHSSGNAGGAGSSFGYSSLSGPYRHGGAMRSYARNGAMGNGGGSSYRGHQCLSSTHSSVMSTPVPNYTTAIRRLHDSPSLSTYGSDVYASSFGSEDGTRTFYAPFMYEQGTPSSSQALIKSEVHQSPAPMLSNASCGSEDSPLGHIYTPPWTLTTATRFPTEGRSTFLPDLGATTY